VGVTWSETIFSRARSSRGGGARRRALYVGVTGLSRAGACSTRRAASPPRGRPGAAGLRWWTACGLHETTGARARGCRWRPASSLDFVWRRYARLRLRLRVRSRRQLSRSSRSANFHRRRGPLHRPVLARPRAGLAAFVSDTRRPDHWVKFTARPEDATPPPVVRRAWTLRIENRLRRGPSPWRRVLLVRLARRCPGRTYAGQFLGANGTSRLSRGATLSGSRAWPRCLAGPSAGAAVVDLYVASTRPRPFSASRPGCALWSRKSTSKPRRSPGPMATAIVPVFLVLAGPSSTRPVAELWSF